jgi:hypothetical protein
LIDITIKIHKPKIFYKEYNYCTSKSHLKTFKITGVVKVLKFRFGSRTFWKSNRVRIQNSVGKSDPDKKNRFGSSTLTSSTGKKNNFVMNCLKFRGIRVLFT